MQVRSKFNATTLFQRIINDEVLCLNICHDHELCKFVHYSEDNCTIYGTGSIPYLPCDVTYKLDRTLRSSTCTFEIPIRPTVQSEPIKVQSDDVTCSGLPSEVTTIHMYLTEKRILIYSISDLVGNYTEIQRLLFAKKPQLHCVSVPVFTGASNSRLYFGNAYNISGYYFLDAYAFTGKCACENGACCANIAIDEYMTTTIPTTLTKYNKFSSLKLLGEIHLHAYVYSQSNKPTRSIHLSEKVNEQQFYIADEKWLV
ncbi:unnamed protein product [Cylicocyclus nassatus]|uniref:Uncharacterized protein n=1 Tax=Cylicocyclus nassatus TaxID=53992 RepID=A0AA36DSR0_CYLNA|nr:unnamed protein product [Cylicocyclus nassatus]